MALSSFNCEDQPDIEGLRRSVAQLRHEAPIILMIHGYRFSPHEPLHSPHEHILSAHPSRRCWKARSWPRQLRLDQNGALGIAFGWNARDSFWEAFERTPAAATALADLIATLQAIAPTVPIHILAHSLGARIALQALSGLAPGSVRRLILLSAAAFQTDATSALAGPAGKCVEVFNVQGRENTLFDLLLRGAYPWAGPTLGRGGVAARNWIDIPLHRTDIRDQLRSLGYPIGAAAVPICHWSSYLRPGVFGLYRSVFYEPRSTPLHLLKRHLAPQRSTEPLWSRMGLPSLTRTSS